MTNGEPPQDPIKKLGQLRIVPSRRSVVLVTTAGFVFGFLLNLLAAKQGLVPSIYGGLLGAAIAGGAALLLVANDRIEKKRANDR